MEELVEAEAPDSADRHRLILGDCLNVLPDLEAGSVDVVVTSPPYNLGLAYRGYDDRKAEDEYVGLAGTGRGAGPAGHEAGGIVLSEHIRFVQRSMDAV